MVANLSKSKCNTLATPSNKKATANLFRTQIREIMNEVKKIITFNVFWLHPPKHMMKNRKKLFLFSLVYVIVFVAKKYL